MRFGRIILKLLNQLEKDQNWLAKSAGVSNAALSRLISCQSSPRLTTAKKLINEIAKKQHLTEEQTKDLWFQVYKGEEQ